MSLEKKHNWKTAQPAIVGEKARLVCRLDKSSNPRTCLALLLDEDDDSLAACLKTTLSMGKCVVKESVNDDYYVVRIKGGKSGCGSLHGKVCGRPYESKALVCRQDGRDATREDLLRVDAWCDYSYKTVYNYVCVYDSPVVSDSDDEAEEPLAKKSK